MPRVSQRNIKFDCSHYEKGTLVYISETILTTSKVSVHFHLCYFQNCIYTKHPLYGEHWIYSTWKNLRDGS